MDSDRRAPLSANYWSLRLLFFRSLQGELNFMCPRMELLVWQSSSALLSLQSFKIRDALDGVEIVRKFQVVKH
jgi:hypothetical protein